MIVAPTLPSDTTQAENEVLIMINLKHNRLFGMKLVVLNVLMLMI